MISPSWPCGDVILTCAPGSFTVLIGPSNCGCNIGPYESRICDLIACVGLKVYEQALPGDLSGGIARALVTEPQVLFLNEPFGVLDQILRRQMNIKLQRIWADTGATALLVTHGIGEAIFLADRVVVMATAPGRIIADIAILFRRPRHPDLFANPHFHRMEDHIAGGALPLPTAIVGKLWTGRADCPRHIWARCKHRAPGF